MLFFNPAVRETNVVLKNESGAEVDVHAIKFDKQGFGVFSLPDCR